MDRVGPPVRVSRKTGETPGRGRVWVRSVFRSRRPTVPPFHDGLRGLATKVHTETLIWTAERTPGTIPTRTHKETVKDKFRTDSKSFQGGGVPREVLFVS